MTATDHRGRARTRRPTVRILVAAAAFGALPAACGIDDTAQYEQTADQLRAQAQQIADDSAQAVASRQPPGTAAATVAEVRSRVPAPPVGYVVRASVPAGTDRAEVGVALDGKVDNYGPGQITARIRLCVLITITSPPDPTSNITDLDCADQAPPPDAVVKFAG